MSWGLSCQWATSYAKTGLDIFDFVINRVPTSWKKIVEILEFHTSPWNLWKVLEFQWNFWEFTWKLLEFWIKHPSQVLFWYETDFTLNCSLFSSYIIFYSRFPSKRRLSGLMPPKPSFCLTTTKILRLGLPQNLIWMLHKGIQFFKNRYA